MNSRKSISTQFSSLFFCITILSINIFESPVFCLESDGQINIESDCTTIPIQKNNEHHDHCFECVDIPFWNYNPDLTFLKKIVEFDFDYFEIYQVRYFDINYFSTSSSFLSMENHHSYFPTFIKYTILLI